MIRLDGYRSGLSGTSGPMIGAVTGAGAESVEGAGGVDVCSVCQRMVFTVWRPSLGSAPFGVVPS